MAASKLDEQTLSLPAREGARAVALELLRDANTAAQRLSAHPTPKSLHNFRVALRRARSWLRAFRTELGTAVREKDRDQLRQIARATSFGRDVDVQLLWARRVARRWSGERRKAAKRFAEYLTSRQRSAGDALDAALLSHFQDVSSEIQERIEAQRSARTRSRRKRTLAVALAAQVAPHLEDVAAALDKVHSVDDEKEAHKARIAAKRLRYLVEPAAPFVKNGRSTLRQLKTLQDDFGLLHDTHMIGHATREASSDGTLGHDVLRRARNDMDVAFEKVRKHWLHRRRRAFSRDIKDFAKRLDSLG